MKVSHDCGKILWAAPKHSGNIFIPSYRKSFQHNLAACRQTNFIWPSISVAPSLIRVEADELTYNLHIMVRFEIELEVIEGRVQVEELPEIWNAKIQEYLGITPS